eukprot:COSAG04_NODE_206_length_20365_cov_4641.461907_2_plen_441_part_00
MSGAAADLLFRALDSNGDGVITAQEMRAGLAANPPPGAAAESPAKEDVFSVAARTRLLAQLAGDNSPSRGGGGGRSPERSPARSEVAGAAPSYDPAFVEALQAQQRARLDETLEATERLLTAKENEINELASRSKRDQTAAAAMEQDLRERLDAATSKLERLQRETAAGGKEQEQKFASELAELKAIRAEELSHLRRQHEDEMEELRTACQEQVATVEANRRAVYDQLARHQRDEAHTADKARDLASMYELQVQQLDQMLKEESQRLAEVRDELCNVTMSSSNEVLKERAEAAELRRKLVVAEEELAKLEGAHGEAVEMARQQERQAAKQGELKAAVIVAEEEWREEGRRKDKEVGRLRRKVQELIQSRAEQQALYDVQLREVRTDVVRMKESHGTTVKFSRQQVEQNKDLMKLTRQLQKEVAISANEVKLLENETQRVR